MQGNLYAGGVKVGGSWVVLRKYPQNHIIFLAILPLMYNK